MSTEETKQEQQTIQIGQNLDGQEKYVLQLLMKIDYVNAQNGQLYNELLVSRREIERSKQENNQILQEHTKIQQDLAKSESERALLRTEKESMLTELGRLRTMNMDLRKKVPVLEEAIEDFDDIPKDSELN